MARLQCLANAFANKLGTCIEEAHHLKSSDICPKRLDVLVAFKILFGAAYTAGTVTMLVCAQREQTVWVLSRTSSRTLTSLHAVFGSAFYVYPLRGVHDIHRLQVYLYADAAAAMSLLVLILLESMSKRSLLIPMDPPPPYKSTLSFFVKPFFPHIVPLLHTGYRRRISLPELRDTPLHLRSDPATKKLLTTLAVEDKTSRRKWPNRPASASEAQHFYYVTCLFWWHEPLLGTPGHPRSLRLDFMFMSWMMQVPPTIIWQPPNSTSLVLTIQLNVPLCPQLTCTALSVVNSTVRGASAYFVTTSWEYITHFCDVLIECIVLMFDQKLYMALALPRAQ
ncbi:hypothetical protein DFH08DRAFT_808350 [Mycena albidolilacea]|uniref:Uncharacterized protein n=1 Tax=Mycena albidolilacea TaxID=1033008 RepID=A0AAD7A354_9AGAR|nr:hypothetical protein DFH08DRAFT_808350 [Mycena albidolilacea]